MKEFRFVNLGTALAVIGALIGAFIVAVHVTGGFFGLHPMPHLVPYTCNCDEEFLSLDEGVARCQIASDFLIALAYLSIPLELIYFFSKSKVLPHRWILLQFGAFIILCGFTHLLNIWTYGPHPYSIALTQTILKFLTAIVSLMTAALLVNIIPTLLNIKIRELFLSHKAAQLDWEMGMIKRQEEAGRGVSLLTHEIRSTLDRHTILNTTLVELARTLHLDNCTVWMPDSVGKCLKLTHELKNRRLPIPITISLTDATVKSIITSSHAIQIYDDCQLGKASKIQNSTNASMAAIRIPLLHVYGDNFFPNESKEACYAVMVLVLEGDSEREWKAHEVETVEVVADQVAVALSHAAVLEDSQRNREALEEQNRSLQSAREKAENAVRARNDFLAVMNHEMRTPLHSIIAVTSVLQGQDSSKNQMAMIDIIMKSSNLLSNLINDVLEFSRMEESNLVLNCISFDLMNLIQEASSLAYPMVKGKSLNFRMHVEKNVPKNVMGDDKRLLHTILNVIGNAVKSTSKGSISFNVSLYKPETNKPIEIHLNELSATDKHAFIQFEVKDTGKGLSELEISSQFQSFGQTQTQQGVECSYGGSKLCLAICQKFVELMDGHIWIESNGKDEGSKVTFIVKLKIDKVPAQQKTNESNFKLLTSELSGLQILVVDDHNINRQVSQEMLRSLGCHVISVDSAAACMNLLTRQDNQGRPFDAIFLDICMPDVDGFDVAMHLLQFFGPRKRPYLIALTARTDGNMREICLRVGMDAVLLKPVCVTEMGSVLYELMRSHNARNRILSR